MEAVTVLELVVLATNDLGLVFVGLGLLLSLVGIGWWMLRPQERSTDETEEWETDSPSAATTEEEGSDDEQTGGFVFSDEEKGSDTDDDSDLGFGNNQW